MEEKYTNEKIYKIFFENYFAEYQEEYRSLLDEMLKEEKLNNIIMDIIKLEEEGLFVDAYVQAHKMMYIMLIIYVVPHMPKKEEIDKWDVIKYLYSEGEDDIASCITGINGDMYSFTEFEDAPPPNKSDVDDIVQENCHLYKLLLEKYGKNKQGQSA